MYDVKITNRDVNGFRFLILHATDMDFQLDRTETRITRMDGREFEIPGIVQGCVQFNFDNGIETCQLLEEIMLDTFGVSPHYIMTISQNGHSIMNLNHVLMSSMIWGVPFISEDIDPQLEVTFAFMGEPDIWPVIATEPTMQKLDWKKLGF